MALPYKSSAAVAYVVSVTHFGNALELHDDLINLSFYDLFYSIFILLTFSSVILYFSVLMMMMIMMMMMWFCC